MTAKVNCHKYIMNRGRTGLIPMSSKQLRSDKISKRSVRSNKTFGMKNERTVNGGEISDQSETGWCQVHSHFLKLDLSAAMLNHVCDQVGSIEYGIHPR